MTCPYCCAVLREGAILIRTVGGRRYRIFHCPECGALANFHGYTRSRSFMVFIGILTICGGAIYIMRSTSIQSVVMALLPLGFYLFMLNRSFREAGDLRRLTRDEWATLNPSTCFNCGTQENSDFIDFDEVRICANCKDEYVQRLREGAET